MVHVAPLLRVAAGFSPPRLGFEYRPSPLAHRVLHRVPFDPCWLSLPAASVAAKVTESWPAGLQRPGPRQLLRMVALVQRVCLVKLSEEESVRLRRENLELLMALASRTPLPACVMSGGMASRVPLRRPRAVRSVAAPLPRGPPPTPATSLAALAGASFADRLGSGVWQVPTNLPTIYEGEAVSVPVRTDALSPPSSASSRSYSPVPTPTSPSMLGANAGGNLGGLASPERCASPALEQFVRRAPANNVWYQPDLQDHWRQVSRSASPAISSEARCTPTETSMLRRSSPAAATPLSASCVCSLAS